MQRCTGGYKRKRLVRSADGLCLEPMPKTCRADVVSKQDEPNAHAQRPSLPDMCLYLVGLSGTPVSQLCIDDRVLLQRLAAESDMAVRDVGLDAATVQRIVHVHVPFWHALNGLAQRRPDLLAIGTLTGQTAQDLGLLSAWPPSPCSVLATLLHRIRAPVALHDVGQMYRWSCAWRAQARDKWRNDAHPTATSLANEALRLAECIMIRMALRPPRARPLSVPPFFGSDTNGWMDVHNVPLGFALPARLAHVYQLALSPVCTDGNRRVFVARDGAVAMRSCARPDGRPLWALFDSPTLVGDLVSPVHAAPSAHRRLYDSIHAWIDDRVFSHLVRLVCLLVDKGAGALVGMRRIDAYHRLPPSIAALAQSNSLAPPSLFCRPLLHSFRSPSETSATIKSANDRAFYLVEMDGRDWWQLVALAPRLYRALTLIDRPDTLEQRCAAAIACLRLSTRPHTAPDVPFVLDDNDNGDVDLYSLHDDVWVPCNDDWFDPSDEVDRLCPAMKRLVCIHTLWRTLVEHGRVEPRHLQRAVDQLGSGPFKPLVQESCGIEPRGTDCHDRARQRRQMANVCVALTRELGAYLRDPLALCPSDVARAQ